MKTTKKFIFFSILAWIFFNVTSVFAASVDHFEVTLTPTSANVWEALDITIEAVDKNSETVPNYNGTIIIFSETDKDAEFPTVLKDSTYKFTSADQGKVKFENAIKFKNPWKQSIQVYDLDDDTIMGMAEADISQWWSSNQWEEINILSPENGITLGKTNIIVSWTTTKNHRIILVINNKDEINTTSDSSWAFEKEITLQEWENFIKAQVLDADNKKIGESENVSVKVSAGKPALHSIKVTPQDDVEPETPINVEVISNQWLSSVTAIIDDVINGLNETSNWVYKWTITAPKKAGKYDIDVVLLDDFWNETKEKAAISVTVIEPILNAGPEFATWTTVWSWIIDTPPIELPVAYVKDPLKITGIKLTVLKTKSILTWDINEKAESYNVYKKSADGTLDFIQNVTNPYFEIAIAWNTITYDYFAIKWVAKTPSGETYEGDLSEATKLQTWPEVFLLVLFALLWGMGFVMYKRKYS